MPPSDAPFDMRTWWARRQAEGQDAIEAAREFGVDIEHLRHLLRLTPSARLEHFQSVVSFVLEGRAAIARQEEEAKRERGAAVAGIDPPTGE
jgi:hypothetical protein